MKERTRGISWISTLLAALLVVAVSAGTASASVAHKKKTLSMSSVAINAGLSTDPLTEEVPQARGYYAQQGVTANLVNDATGNANLVAELVSGAAQFIVVGASTGLVDFAAGTPIRGVMEATIAPPQEILLSTAIANKFNVPATASGQAGTLAQFDALKGSHVTIGVSTLTSESYLDLSGLGALHGFTVNTSPSADIQIVTTGSATTLASGLLANKFNGIANSPPTTVIPGFSGITIQLAKIKPLNAATWEELLTTTSMIQQHRDTVQAVVNAMVEGFHYAKLHPAGASAISNQELSNLLITSPETQDFLDQEFIAHLPNTPAITRGSVDDELAVLKATTPSLAVTFDQFADNKFVDNAIKEFGYHYAL